jgi:DNA invertase Pin-like site-specific DNA recombinase
MAMNRQAIAYRRVSTAKQGRSGLGLEAQDAAINSHVRATGCTLVATYTEVESGKKSARPELAKALSHAKKLGAVLVIAKLDRLSRNVHFLSGLMEAGVDFVCCDMPSAGRLTLHIMAAVAEDEARRISERTVAALAAAKERGAKLGGIRQGQRHASREECAAGGVIGGAKTAVLNRREAFTAYAGILPVVESLRAAGRSFQAIADHLNTEGYTTRTGASWGARQVMRVLERAAS